ncbi:copper amine oxidase N-terminal domain-containing protein [Thermoanaerobacterium thermosaccharolyticum]|uniref:copper amine oxidase N-terminal domain-containing protein n=1 Tax=Thermoanaerobacterium thermosaccharolyticum TaxID=1517 RepID=UPI0027A552D1|nr:copper amine oxidase N-terminal domain-containing protein [Thermoanaerobacterium thermosaccharolyticum]
MFRNKYRLIVFISIIILLLLSSVCAVPYIKLVINGQQIYTDVPPQIVNGTTLVPIRIISETLGAKVNWDGNTQTVTVNMPQETLEAHTVDSFWNLYTSHNSITEPKIGDSVTPEFKNVLRKALDLLKQKDFNAYMFICAYIPEIDEQPNKDDKIGAWTDGTTLNVYFNSNYVKHVVTASNNSWGVEYTAITLAHEAFHESTYCSGSIVVISDSPSAVEIPAYEFEYSVAKHLGVNQDLLNWIKQQITTRID